MDAMAVLYSYVEKLIKDRLKKLKVGYQILWKKDKERETWLTKELGKLRPKEMKIYIKEDGYFCKNKTKYYVRTRFVIISQNKDDNYRQSQKIFSLRVWLPAV